jgi:hypothetical protein
MTCAARLPARSSSSISSGSPFKEASLANFRTDLSPLQHPTLLQDDFLDVHPDLRTGGERLVNDEVLGGTGAKHSGRHKPSPTAPARNRPERLIGWILCRLSSLICRSSSSRLMTTSILRAYASLVAWGEDALAIGRHVQEVLAPGAFLTAAFGWRRFG